MTDDQTSRNASTPRSGPAALVLRLRTSTGSRVAMRRAASDSTAHYSYPYLAGLWTGDGNGWRRQPVLLLAAAAATSTVGHDADERLGRYLRRAALANATGDPDRDLDRIGRRLMAAQTGDLRKLHQAVARHLTANPHHGRVDWDDIWWTYATWDHPNRAKRRDRRRRLLEDFYRPIPAATTVADVDVDATP